jgi:hypothetical protein
VLNKKVLTDILTLPQRKTIAFQFYGCIVVYDNCNSDRDSYTRIGTHWRNCTYANDTAFEDFLTGAQKFTVKEIEVFEIAD